MHTRCPRCQLEFDAVSAWIQCPRCGAPFAAPTLAHSSTPVVPGTQAMDPAAIAQVLRASTPNPLPPAPAPFAQPSALAAPANGFGSAYRAPNLVNFVADEDLAGRAVVSVVMSVIALVGGCNPVGLVGVTMGLMAYGAANDQRVDLARARGRRARRVAWASLVITVAVWGVAALSLFYTFSL